MIFSPSGGTRFAGGAKRRRGVLNLLRCGAVLVGFALLERRRYRRGRTTTSLNSEERRRSSEALAKKLQLPTGQIIQFAQTVGYPKT